jgi:hypothetical protein
MSGFGVDAQYMEVDAHGEGLDCCSADNSSHAGQLPRRATGSTVAAVTALLLREAVVLKLRSDHLIEIEA